VGPANLLTALRILLIPVFVSLLIYRRYGPAVAVFIVAAVTDGLDGMVARLTGRRTRLGALLDPTADKLLSVSSFVALALRGPIPVWFVVLVISRDLIISLGALMLFLSEGTLEIAPSRVGKATTFFQFLTILLTLLLLIDGRLAPLWRAALIAAAGFTVLSGLQYLAWGLSPAGEKRAP